MHRWLDVGTSLAGTLARVGTGISVGVLGARPVQPLELYEFEACPYCRKVREALTVLDLDARIFPCPKGGTRFRPVLRARGGKEQFPYLIDPNTSKEMYESDEIVRTLFVTYGDGVVPGWLRPGALSRLTLTLPSAFRPGGGLRATPSTAPAQPLELYGFESSPFCRIAREALCSLEIPYLLHNVGKGSPRREAFVARSGKMMVPYLVDPNADVALFESADIVRHLERHYGAAVP